MKHLSIYPWIIILLVLGMPSTWAQEPDTSSEHQPEEQTVPITPAPILRSLLSPPDIHPAVGLVSEPVHIVGLDTTEISEVIEIRGSLDPTTAVDVTPAARARYSPVTSAVKLIESVPGVIVNEGDAFGSDDWSTLVTIRGLQSESQHVGTTIDGLPNGGSNYGGGAKANRFVDVENLATISVSHGTANAPSLSREALGATIDYVTDEPRSERGARATLTSGNQGARRLFLRLDTGEIRPGLTAYGAYSNTFVERWLDRTSFARRDHAETKARAVLGPVTVTARYSFDDVREQNYQSVSLAQFRDNPGWDRLTSEWRGIPYIDQAHRKTWMTLRTNQLAYLKADFRVAGFDVSVTPYYHRLRGRGDWNPPYQVEVDGELPVPNVTRFGGVSTATVHYTDSAGVPLSPVDDCTAEFTFPYGASGPAYHPDCYDEGAVPVSSYRHTHYSKDRLGARLEATRRIALPVGVNRLRVGLWYEDYRHDRLRDWHRIVDATSSPHFEETPYWVQFERRYKEQLWSWYLRDEHQVGRWTFQGGLQQFITTMERRAPLEQGETLRIQSNARPLGHAQVLYRPTESLRFMAGFAESQATVKEFAMDLSQRIEAVDPETGTVTVLDPLADVEPERAQTVEVGARFNHAIPIGLLSGAATFYAMRFANRITEISTRSPESGIDFLELEDRGIPRNIGGIDTRGVEAMLSWQPGAAWRAYSGFSYNHSVYRRDVSSAGVFAENLVIMSPRSTLLVGIEYRDPLGLRAGLTMRHVSSYVGTLGDAEGRQEQIPAYSIVNMNVAYPIPGLTDTALVLHINNLTDARYITGGPGGQGAYLLGARRSSTLTVSGQL